MPRIGVVIPLQNAAEYLSLLTGRTNEQSFPVCLYKALFNQRPSMESLQMGFRNHPV